MLPDVVSVEASQLPKSSLRRVDGSDLVTIDGEPDAVVEPLHLVEVEVVTERVSLVSPLRVQ